MSKTALLALTLTGCSGVTELAPPAATIAPAPAETPSAPALDEVVTPAEPPAAAPESAATALSVLNGFVMITLIVAL